MARRGLGAKGYYAQSREGGREKQHSPKEDQHSHAPLVVAVLVLIALYFVLSNAPGAIPSALGGATPTPYGFQTPSPGGSATPTPFGQTPVPATPTQTVEATLAPGQTPTPTPTLSAGQKRFLINTSIGPTNYSVGSTVLSVLKNLFVTENSYKETVDVQNVGQNAVGFYLIDVIPKQFEVSVWDADFGTTSFDALSDRVARFYHSLEPGERAVHGPVRLPIGNTTQIISRVFIEKYKDAGPSEGMELFLPVLLPAIDAIPILVPTVPPSFEDPAQELNEIIQASESDEEAAVMLDYLAQATQTENEISGAIGKDLDYSLLKEVTVTISENRLVATVPFKIKETSGKVSVGTGMAVAASQNEKPLFVVEGEATKYADAGKYEEKPEKLEVDFDFQEKTKLVNGRIPFDHTEATLNLSFPPYGKQTTFPIKIKVKVQHVPAFDSSSAYEGEFSGKMIWPAEGPVTDIFGFRPRRGRMHKGIDIGASGGSPIKSPADGVIKSAAWNDAFGNLVIVDHGSIDGKNVQTYHAHQQRFNVQAGQAVKQGDVIGFVDSTGRSSGNHLHFQVMENGVAVNPMNYLSPR